MRQEAAFLCDETWDSTVNSSQDDGIFDLQVDGNGVISGYHFLRGSPKIPVTGQCQHSPQHHIEIDETRNDGSKYHYSAQVIPEASGKHFTKDGKRRKTFKDKFDDDVWTGVRTT